MSLSARIVDITTGASPLAFGCPRGESSTRQGRGGKEAKPEPPLLAPAYRAALRQAAEHAVRSVAFPAISTGIYGYPLDLGTEVAVETSS